MYRLNQLEESVRERVLQEYHRDWLEFEEWWDIPYDDIKLAGELIGFEITNIFFQTHCQGAGATIEGGYVYRNGSVAKIREEFPTDETLQEIAQNLYEIQRANFYCLSATVKHWGFYYHDKCNIVSVDDDRWWYNGWVAEGMEEEITEALRSFMRWAFGKIERHEDFLYSDKYTAMMIENRGDLFSSEGIPLDEEDIAHTIQLETEADFLAGTGRK